MGNSLPYWEDVFTQACTKPEPSYAFCVDLDDEVVNSGIIAGKGNYLCTDCT